MKMEIKEEPDDSTKNVPVQQDEVVKEGKAEILVENKKIFYNPVQEFNRDLSIAVLSTFTKSYFQDQDEIPNNSKSKDTSKGMHILEALSASGLRSIRYAKEIPSVERVLANDISKAAVQSIQKNIIHNKVEHVVESSNEDAVILMHQNRKKFHIVDLDPYGCPSIFLDSAVQSVKDGGLLLVTATDMAVLAGNSPETCYVKYGAVSLKSKACHEIALRILLQNIAAHAGRYSRYIIPILSISADFYIRVFVKIYSSALTCKKNLSKLGLVYQCLGCESITLQPIGLSPSEKVFKLPHVPSVDKLCEHCNNKHIMGGPIWLDSIHDKEFVSNILSSIEDDNDNIFKSLGTIKRIEGILHVIFEELDVPLYYTLERLMSIVRCQTPPMSKFRSALLNAGYKVSYSHAHKTSVKTDAPNSVIWDIVKAWEKHNPIKRDKLKPDSVPLLILNKESKIDVSFHNHPEANPYSRQKGFTRFQQNPQAHWGPGTRSVTRVDTNNTQVKQKKNKKVCKDDSLRSKRPKIEDNDTTESKV